MAELGSDSGQKWQNKQPKKLEPRIIDYLLLNDPLTVKELVREIKIPERTVYRFRKESLERGLLVELDGNRFAIHGYEEGIPEYGKQIVTPKKNLDFYLEHGWKFLSDGEAPSVIVEYSRKEDNHEIETVQLPVWFRTGRNVMENIQSMFKEVSDENGITPEKLEQFNRWLDHSLCATGYRLVVTSELCSRSESLWQSVSKTILRGRGDKETVLLFLLYEVRTALLLHSYKYLQDARLEMDLIDWYDNVSLFFDRWNKITRSLRYSGSLEERITDDVFSGFILRENILPEEQARRYIELIYDAVKWHSISRNAHIPFFTDEHERKMKAFQMEGVRLLNNERQHKAFNIYRHARPYEVKRRHRQRDLLEDKSA